MKLSTQTVLRLVDALNFFNDGHKLNGTVRMAMAQNVHRMAEIAGAYQKARNAVIYDLSGGTGQLPPEKVAEGEKQIQELLDEVHEVNLIRFRLDQINADDNKLPVRIIAGLMPLMRDADTDVIPPVDAPANDAAAPSAH